MTYLLDASTFTEAEKRWYSLDFCPAYWDWIEEMNSQGEVYSVEKVREKLFATHKAGPFFHWAAQRKKALFLPPNRTILENIKTINRTITTSKKYSHTAIVAFLEIPDIYLIAHAYTNNWTIVTHEHTTPRRSPHNIKIPGICRTLNINYIDPFTMLRTKHVKFILAPPPPKKNNPNPKTPQPPQTPPRRSWPRLRISPHRSGPSLQTSLRRNRGLGDGALLSFDLVTISG